MAGTIDLNYNQQFAGTPVFKDAAGNVTTVDAIRWTLSDSMGGVFAQNGEGVSFVADKTHPADAAARTALLKADVDEAGVANAFTDSWEVVVHGPATPPATGMTMDFQVTDQP
jgi:hypothetical protein